MGQEKLICSRCNQELEPATVNLEYLGHKMKYQFPACPVCKQVYVPEEIVTGKIHKIEKELEDK